MLNMNLKKLGCLVTALGRTNKNVLIPRLSTHQSAAACLRYKSEKSTAKLDDDDDLEKPISFSNSGAAKWDPVYSRTGPQLDDRPWYQTYVIIASVSTFLIYFCILREENDIDQKLTLELSDHFQGEQKANLIKSQKIAEEFAQNGNYKLK